MTEFRFTNEHSPTNAANITGILRQPRLWIPTEKDYPAFGSWLDKTEAQLASGEKRAMTAHMGREAIGAVIYQQSRDNPGVLELRNISIAPDARGRYVGSFLLRNTEIEAITHDFSGIEEITVDTKIANEDMIAFLLSQGYDIKEISDLYGTGSGLDVTLSKSIA